MPRTSTPVRLPFVSQGAPGGTPVVLLHGFADSLRSFEPVLASLPRTLRAYSVTQRGHAGAPRPGSYRIEDSVADVVAFLDAAGHEAAVLVGHSMGSAVAARIAIDHPERVSGLVLMGASTSFSRCEALAGVAGEMAELIDPVDRGWLRAFQEETVEGPIAESWLETVVDESARIPIDVLRAAWRDTVLVDFSDELHRIAAPTLLAWGDHDAFVPYREQEALLDAIPGARLRAYDMRGHGFHWEVPDVFAADVAAFADGV